MVLQRGSPQTRPVPKAGICWLDLPTPVCRNEPITRDFTLKGKREKDEP